MRVKIRDGQVANRPVYVAVGCEPAPASATCSALWVGTGGEGAKHWMAVPGRSCANRGVADVCIAWLATG